MDGPVASTIEAFWSERYGTVAPRIRDWLELDYIRTQYIDRAKTGSADLDWFSASCERFIRPAGRVLEIGCGASGLGPDLCRYGVAEHVVGIDFSTEAIRVSKDRAAGLGLAARLDYLCGDVATMDFGVGEFDAVVVRMALHHVLRLEDLFVNVRRWLRRGGHFVIDEYVGPDRFQWTESTLREGQRMLESLNERYRVHGVSGEVVRTFARPAYAAMVIGDPSEAIRSSAIVPLLETYFELVERRDYGGTVLQWLLADIVHNFDPQHEPADAAVLERLFDDERRLLQDGTIESNFATFVVR